MATTASIIIGQDWLVKSANSRGYFGLCVCVCVCGATPSALLWGQPRLTAIWEALCLSVCFAPPKRTRQVATLVGVHKSDNSRVRARSLGL